MNIHITGLHLEVTSAIQEYVEKKFERVFRHVDNVTKAEVVLSSDQHTPTAKINVHIPGKDIHCESTGQTLYAAIDLLADKTDRRLLKIKEKRSH